MYVAPYLALLPEIAWTLEERVDLSTLMAVFAIPAVVFGTVWTLGFDGARGAGLSPTDAIRAVVIGGSVVALVLCLLPIVFIDERRHCHSEADNQQNGQEQHPAAKCDSPVPAGLVGVTFEMKQNADGKVQQHRKIGQKAG